MLHLNALSQSLASDHFFLVSIAVCVTKRKVIHPAVREAYSRVANQTSLTISAILLVMTGGARSRRHAVALHTSYKVGRKYSLADAASSYHIGESQVASTMCA